MLSSRVVCEFLVYACSLTHCFHEICKFLKINSLPQVPLIICITEWCFNRQIKWMTWSVKIIWTLMRVNDTHLLDHSRCQLPIALGEPSHICAHTISSLVWHSVNSKYSVPSLSVFKCTSPQLKGKFGISNKMFCLFQFIIIVNFVFSSLFSQ